MIKTAVKTIIILVLIVLTGTGVFAAVVEKEALKSEIEEYVVSKLSKYIDGDIEAEVKYIPFRELSVPSGERKIVIEINSSDFSSRKMATVTIYVNGRKVKKFGVPVSLKLYKKVWIATENVKRGKSLSNSNVVLEKLDVTREYKNVITSEKNLTDYIASRNIRSGQIIDKRFVISKPDVMKNSVVSVIFTTKGLKISIDAKATHNASVGDYVKVKSDIYEKYYTGVVVSPNKVLVEI